jgi:hypothetical protein
LRFRLRGTAQLPIWRSYGNYGPSAATPRNPGSTTKDILLQSDVAATGVLTHCFQQAARAHSGHPSREATSPRERRFPQIPFLGIVPVSGGWLTRASAADSAIQRTLLAQRPFPHREGRNWRNACKLSHSEFGSLQTFPGTRQKSPRCQRRYLQPPPDQI